MESDKNLPDAIKALEDALLLAKTTGASYAALAATNILGAAYIYQKNVKQGEDLLAISSPNKTLLLDFSRLEMLAFAYQAAQLPDKSAEIWHLLLDKAQSIGNQYFVGEAAQKLGDINRNKNQADVAFGYYETAARSLRLVG